MDILMLKAKPIATAEASPRPVPLGRPDTKSTGNVQGNSPPGTSHTVLPPEKEAPRTGQKTPENLLDLFTGLTNKSNAPATDTLSVALGQSDVAKALQDIKLPPTLDDIVKAMSLIGIQVPANAAATTELNSNQQTLFKAVAGAKDLPTAAKQVLDQLLTQALSRPLPASNLIDMARTSAPTPLPVAVGPRPKPQPLPVDNSSTVQGTILGQPDTGNAGTATITATGNGTASGMTFDSTVVSGLNLTEVHLGRPDLGNSNSDAHSGVDIIGNSTNGSEANTGVTIVGNTGNGIVGANQGNGPSTTSVILGIPNGGGNGSDLTDPGTGNTGGNGLRDGGPMPVEKGGATTIDGSVPPANGGLRGTDPLPVEQGGSSSTTGLGIRGQIDPLPGQGNGGVDPGTGSTDGSNGSTSVPPHKKPGDPEIGNQVTGGFKPNWKARHDADEAARNKVATDAQHLGDDVNVDVISRPHHGGHPLGGPDQGGLIDPGTGSTDGTNDDTKIDGLPGTERQAPSTITTNPATTTSATEAKTVKSSLQPQTVDSVAKQITDRIESMALARRSGTVTIKLNPYDLGSVTLTIKSFGSKIDTDIKASNDEVRTALNVHRTDLVNTIESKGLTMNSFTVGQEANQQAGQQQSQQSNYAETQRTAQLQAGMAVANTAPVAQAPVAYSGSTTVMDLVV